MKKMLIAYYTYSHGNTAWVAERLQEATGADLVQIETVEPYPDEYNDTVDQAKREIEAGYLPAIEAVRANPDDYDVVAIGTPTWWYTMAPAVRTFIEQHAWAGKTVIPFATDAGWMGTVLDDIADACAGAEAAAPFEARFDTGGGDTLVTGEHEVDAWCGTVSRLLQA